MARYIKTYKTRSNEARIPLQLGDVMVDAHFINGNIRDNQWATLTTKDALVQFVIENSPLYNRNIFLDSAVLIEEPEPEKELNIEDVVTLQDARDYMVKKYGVVANTIIAPNALKAQMKKHQVEFPNAQF